MVLSLSITAFAAWLGIEQRPLHALDGDAITFAMRALLCAALLVVWRAIDRRVRPSTDFSPLFEHFAATLALFAGFVLMTENETRLIGGLITIVVATIVIAWGVYTRRESFVLYAFVFAVVAADVLVDALLFTVVSTIGAIAALVAIHSRMKDGR
jgi:hypothetical protein